MPQARSLLCSPLRAVFGRTLNEACGLAVRPRLRLDMPKLLSIVPDAKEYISGAIDDPEAIYDPEIWDAPGFALVLSWLAQKWHRKCLKLAPGGSKNPQQGLSKEQQETCLNSASAELIREIKQLRPLN